MRKKVKIDAVSASSENEVKEGQFYIKKNSAGDIVELKRRRNGYMEDLMSNGAVEEGGGDENVNVSVKIPRGMRFQMGYDCSITESFDFSDWTSLDYAFDNSHYDSITMDVSSMTDFGKFGNTSEITLKNFGKPETLTLVDFESVEPWSSTTLYDSLYTYSFDRAEAGFQTCEVRLHSDILSELDSQQIGKIESKGYTLTSSRSPL